MAFLPNGQPELSPKQVDLVRLCKKPTGVMKFILVGGSRISGKSVGCQAAIADHLWNTKDASVLVLCYTAGAAATSGIWNELTEKTLPDWIAQDFGMEWIQEPKIHGATKKMFCSVRNKHGGISKLELDSLDDEREVEKKYKSRYYSMIYWSEAGEFKQELSMTTLMMALRIQGLPDDQHVLLIDCNPPDDGMDHFLYKFFYELRIARPDNLDVADQMIQRCLHVTTWGMDDNPFVSDEKKAIVKKMYANNPDLYARYVDGKWTKATKGALFADVFLPKIHIQRDEKGEAQTLIAEEDCEELITGNDAGGVNPCSHFIEKVMVDREGKQVSMFKVLDELAFIGQEISVAEFTQMFVEKMDGIENELGHKLEWNRWRHWADSSAISVKESIAARTVADEMFTESSGRIRLIGVDKGRGSVGNRIRLVRKLLIQQRILISPRCVKLIDALQSIRAGKVPGTIASQSPHKHPFDSFSYALARELWDELQDSVMQVRTLQKKAQGSGLVSVRL